MSSSEKLEIDSTIHHLGDLNAQYAYLRRVDLPYASKLKPQDSYRIVRALEIYFSTQTAPSVYFANNPPKPILKSCEIFEIYFARELLRTRIQERTQEMLNKGLLNEVQTLIARYGTQHQWAKSIGIKETLAYLNYQKSWDSSSTKPQSPIFL